MKAAWMDSGLRELVALSALSLPLVVVLRWRKVFVAFWRRDRLLTSAARLAITPASETGFSSLRMRLT
jgi:hypothetical protein